MHPSESVFLWDDDSSFELGETLLFFGIPLERLDITNLSNFDKDVYEKNRLEYLKKWLFKNFKPFFITALEHGGTIYIGVVVVNKTKNEAFCFEINDLDQAITTAQYNLANTLAKIGKLYLFTN